MTHVSYSHSGDSVILSVYFPLEIDRDIDNICSFAQSSIGCASLRTILCCNSCCMYTVACYRYLLLMSLSFLSSMLLIVSKTIPNATHPKLWAPKSRLRLKESCQPSHARRSTSSSSELSSLYKSSFTSRTTLSVLSRNFEMVVRRSLC